MTATAEQQQVTETLLQDVQQTAFPSVAQLDRIERMISTPDELELYVTILTEKVEATRYPHRPLLDRLERLLGVLQRYADETHARR